MGRRFYAKQSNGLLIVCWIKKKKNKKRIFANGAGVPTNDVEACFLSVYIGYYEPSEDKMMRNYATTDPSDCYKTRYRSVADKERKKNLFLLGLSPARIFIYV